MSKESGTRQQGICGIIMPISYVDDDHTADHWDRVRQVIEVAIEQAGLMPRPVWQNGEFDVIQARILKNIFENDIVICDISTRNPNVMLEFGMRLTTKKPTIVIAEEGTTLPFDTSIIGTEFYERGLDYIDTAKFISRLANAIGDTLGSVINGTYHSFMEHFRFETVEPETISITADKLIEARLDEILSRVSRLDTSLANSYLRAREGAVQRSSDTAPIEERDMLPRSPGTFLNPDIVLGSRVHHAKFGDGTVVEVEGNKLEAEFDRAGRKRVMHAFVDLLRREN